MSAWRERAWEIIVSVDQALPDHASLKEREAALNEAAWYAHQGTSWGKKVWATAKRQHLERHGKVRRVSRVPLPLFGGAAA